MSLISDNQVYNRNAAVQYSKCFQLIMGNRCTANFYEEIATSMQEVIGGKAAVVYPRATN